MKIVIRSFIIVIICLTFTGVDSRLPSYIQVCSRNDPHISDCIIKSIRSLQPYLVSGMKELDVPSAEPLFLKSLSYGNDRSVKVQLTNVYIKGITGFRVEKLRTNFENIKFDVIASFPRLEIRSKYKLILSLLGAPITSDGDLYAVFDSAKARIGLKAQKYLRNGVEYMKFEPILLKINIGKVSALRLSNLFNGNPVLSEVVHALLVSNSDFLLNDFYPHIEKSLSDLFTDVANKITKEATFDELFPF